MKYTSVFDIIGPVMIGPSSSHTAGAARIGLLARKIFGGQPKKIVVTFYGSFAKTYKGHGTDLAIIGGILDFDASDPRIPHSLDIAKENGIDVTFLSSEQTPRHPNTVAIWLSGEQSELEVTGISIGGGKVDITEINGFDVSMSGIKPTIIVLHKDRCGAIAAVTHVLSTHDINIGHMEVSRKEEGKMALMIIEVDHKIDESVMNELNALENISKVVRIID